MLKGISRQMVEINTSENPYFERIFLVVRANCTEPSSARIQHEANKLLNAHSPHTGMRIARHKHRLKQLLLLCLGGSIGVLISHLVSLIG